MSAAAYEYEHVVTFDDTNVVGNVYFTSYLSWQGRCRELFLHERAPAVLAQLADGLALVTTSCSCEFYDELRAFDRVSVRMTLEAVRQNRVAMAFDYVRGDQLVARGRQEIACIRRTDDGAVTAVMPAELESALRPYAERPA